MFSFQAPAEGARLREENVRVGYLITAPGALKSAGLEIDAVSGQVDASQAAAVDGSPGVSAHDVAAAIEAAQSVGTFSLVVNVAGGATGAGRTVGRDGTPDPRFGWDVDVVEAYRTLAAQADPQQRCLGAALYGFGLTIRPAALEVERQLGVEVVLAELPVDDRGDLIRPVNVLEVREVDTVLRRVLGMDR